MTDKELKELMRSTTWDEVKSLFYVAVALNVLIAALYLLGLVDRVVKCTM